MPDGAAMEGELRRVLAFCALPYPAATLPIPRVGESGSVGARPAGTTSARVPCK